MDVQCGCLFHGEEEKENKETETRMGIYMEQKVSLWTIVLINRIFFNVPSQNKSSEGMLNKPYSPAKLLHIKIHSLLPTLLRERGLSELSLKELFKGTFFPKESKK